MQMWLRPKAPTTLMKQGSSQRLVNFDFLAYFVYGLIDHSLFLLFQASFLSTAFLALIFTFQVLFLVSLLLYTLLKHSLFCFLGIFLIYYVHCLSGSHFRFFDPILVSLLLSTLLKLSFGPLFSLFRPFFYIQMPM